MPKEIERKFLVSFDHINFIERIDPRVIQQGYIPTSNGVTVRVRTECIESVNGFTRFGWITIKGKSGGLSRDEYEYRIDYKDAKEMLDNLTESKIQKVRWAVDRWEVDVFLGDNQGLIIAEMEFREDEDPNDLVIPDWVGEEVTLDFRYTNLHLSKHPYRSWNEKI